MPTFRGLQDKHEHAAQTVARDTRPLGTRVAEFFTNPVTIYTVYSCSIFGSIVYPALNDIFLLSSLGLYSFASTRKYKLPFRMPRTAAAVDYNDLIPGTTKARKAGGISFFGNDITTQEELWFTNDDLRTHVLIFGSTGSGKTEALVSIAYNSLVQGSGFIYVDGKGDNSLFAKVFSMVRSMGREDDLLLINFMTGARDVLGPQENRLSNTMNPFASGSSSMISQLVVSLMDSSSEGGNGDMWKGRAINFVESLMKVLCAMRDGGHILLDANSIREYFILEKLEEMVVDKMFPLDDGRRISLDDYPVQILEPLKSYILNLPGYNPGNKGKQASEVREQHGFITMQLTRVFSSLADTYGHIIRTNLAEVDLKDVVLNRRILVVLLPALEKSPDELANLGKVIIASLKAMMASGLGDAVEGDYRDVILRKPTNAPTPYVCIMDEYGYYAVKGFAVVPAQARSLGFSAVFAGQDLPAFQKASKEEAASIGANCNIKICMKLEDPQETWDFFNKVAGETYVTNVSGFQMNAGSMTMNYMDTKNASVDRRQRIELLDLKDQREGEAHIFFKSRIVRATMFYANPKPVKKMRINHFIKVEAPIAKDLIDLDKRLRKYIEVFENENATIPAASSNEDVNYIVESLNDSRDLQPFEQGLAALISILEKEVTKQKNINSEYEENEEERLDTNIFTKVPITKLIKSMIKNSAEEELFVLPILRLGSTLEEIKNIERLCGSNSEAAEKISKDIMQDLEVRTTYPPLVEYKPERYEILDDINALIKELGGEEIEPTNLPEHQVYDESMHAALNFGKDYNPDNTHDLPEPDNENKDDLPSLSDLPDLPDVDVLEKMLSEVENDTDSEKDFLLSDLTKKSDDEYGVGDEIVSDLVEKEISEDEQAKILESAESSMLGDSDESTTATNLNDDISENHSTDLLGKESDDIKLASIHDEDYEDDDSISQDNMEEAELHSGTNQYEEYSDYDKENNESDKDNKDDKLTKGMEDALDIGNFELPTLDDIHEKDSDDIGDDDDDDYDNMDDELKDEKDD